MNLDRHAIRSISSRFGAQYASLHCQPRGEHRRIICGTKPNDNEYICAGPNLSGQSHVKTFKPDVVEHCIDLESISIRIFSAHCCREGFIDSQPPATLQPDVRQIIYDRTLEAHLSPVANAILHHDPERLSSTGVKQ